jgi:hypothetical protein
VQPARALADGNRDIQQRVRDQTIEIPVAQLERQPGGAGTSKAVLEDCFYPHALRIDKDSMRRLNIHSRGTRGHF